MGTALRFFGFILSIPVIVAATFLPTDIDEARKKFPDIFLRGFHQLHEGGKGVFVCCGVGIRYFDDESIEPTEDLWLEAELDAKEQILSHFRRQRKKDVDVEIRAMSPLFHWKEGKRSYFRNFIVRIEDLTVIEPTPPKPPPGPITAMPIKREKTARQSDEADAAEKKKADAEKKARDEFVKKLAEARSLYYSGEYCEASGAFASLPAGILPISRDDRSLAERSNLLCDIANGNNIPKAYELVGDAFYATHDHAQSYFYYREYINWVFEKERWLKNVPENILFRCAYCAYKLKLKSQARNLILELERYYPFGEPAVKGRKLLERIENE